MFTNRPNSEETEDDLLAFQRAFLASGSRPSATVIKKRKSDEAKDITGARDVVTLDDGIKDAQETKKKPKIVSTSEKSKKETSHIFTENVTKDDEDMEKKMDEHDTHITAVLSKIEERNINQIPITFPTFRTSPFPSVFHRTVTNPGPTDVNTLKPRKSIFARQFKEKSPKDYGIIGKNDKYSETELVPTCPLRPLPDTISINKLKDIYPEPRVVSGAGLSATNNPKFSVNEGQKIHEENIQKISTMSEAEVLAEKAKLLHELNPTLVKFLQNRATSKHVTKEEKFLQDLAKQSQEENIMLSKDIESVEDITENGNATEDEMTTEFAEKEKFVHMDIVEPEKLAWMEKIPEKQRNKPTLTYRFDFDGNILDNNADVPSHIGLHHHGDEPDRPGYNLQELFILSRSNFTQQRVFAVTLLGKIMSKAKSGKNIEKASKSVLGNLLESGILFLLRWSLDEQSETLLQASVFALHSLLCSPQCESLEETMFLSNRGCEILKLNPNANIKQDDSDYEIAQKDVVVGLLNMKLLSRIRYMLEVCNPSPVTINHCLDILTRISQHSIKSSVEIYECPRLLSFIIKSLVPITSNSAGSECEGDGYPLQRYPFPKAVKLLRRLCVAGRHITSRLLNDHKEITTIILKHVSSNKDPNYFETECEVLKLWIVFCSYGFLCDLFSELYQIIILQLQSCTSMLSSSDKNKNDKVDEKLLKKCELIIKLGSVVLSSSKIDNLHQWKEISEQTEVIMVIVISLYQNTKSPELLPMLQTILDFLTSYCEMLHDKTKYDVITSTTYSERLSNNILPLVFKCLNLLHIGNPVVFGKKEKIPSMPEIDVGSITSEDVMTYQLLSSYLQCCVTICRLNKNCCHFFQSSITYIIENFQWMLSTDEYLSNYYLRSRIYCLYWSVTLNEILVANIGENFNQHGLFFYTVAFRGFTQLSSGDEHLMHSLLSSLIFHPDLMKNAINSTAALTKSIATMNVSKNISELTPDSQSIVSSAISKLPSIRSTYLSSLYVHPKILSESRSRIFHKVDDISTFLLKSDTDGSSVPTDWPFIPLLQIYDHSISRGDLPGGSLTHISNTLSFLCLLEYSCRDCLATVSVTAKIVRLMCVFLAGNDIFLEPPVKKCLMFLFSHYCGVSTPELLDFSLPIPGISSFYDFYISLLEQYEGVSYGDELFSAVVLLPLHQQNNGISDIKKALWCDRRDILRILSLPVVKLLIPVSWFLSPIESDIFMIRSYISALACGYCSAQRCPVPYLIAIHHTAQFLFNKEVDVPLTSRKEIYRGVLKIKQDEVRKLILYYVSTSDDVMGFKIFDELSETRNEEIKILSN